MAKRIVALYSKVSSNQSDENAFLNRSKKSSKEVLPFTCGVDFLNNLRVHSSKGIIDDLRVHSHGFSGGIISDGFNEGIYTQEYKDSTNTVYSVATYDIAGYFSRGLVDFSQNAQIILYGCNNSIFALELSRYLRVHGRKDISVTGANNSVYESGGVAKGDSNNNGIDKPGKFITYKNGGVIKSVSSLSYK